jgi:hypothetical protein
LWVESIPDLTLETFIAVNTAQAALHTSQALFGLIVKISAYIADAGWVCDVGGNGGVYAAVVNLIVATDTLTDTILVETVGFLVTPVTPS